MKNYKLIGARSALGLTQKSMSEKIGISKGSYFEKENGKKQFNLNEIVSILKILGLTFEEVFM